jgi:hypothetical protein
MRARTSNWAGTRLCLAVALSELDTVMPRPGVLGHCQFSDGRVVVRDRECYQRDELQHGYTTLASTRVGCERVREVMHRSQLNFQGMHCVRALTHPSSA